MTRKYIFAVSLGKEILSTSEKYRYKSIDLSI